VSSIAPGATEDLPRGHLGVDAKCAFLIPADAAGSTIHLVLEVTDQNKIVSLADYRRIVITVASNSP
jgi:hypothetical protein